MSKKTEIKTGTEKSESFHKLPAQDVLPFPPIPSASIAGMTMQESVYHVAWAWANGVLYKLGAFSGGLTCC